MRAFVVTGFQATFGPGFILALTAEQADRREHLIRVLEDDELKALLKANKSAKGLPDGTVIVECEDRCNFKRGEGVIVLDGNVDKVSLSVMAEYGSDEAEAAIAEVEEETEKARTVAAAREAAEAANEKKRQAIKKAGAAASASSSAEAAKEAAEAAASARKGKKDDPPDTTKQPVDTEAGADGDADGEQGKLQA